MPKTMLLDNSHFKTICTRVQLAAQQCPAAAQYGTRHGNLAVARAGTSPGPVYLVSSNDKLPNLVADLRGQINVQLRGVISLGEGRDEGDVPGDPGCSGDEVRPEDAGRQQGP